VQGRAQNVSGTYASRKMGLTIQFESHKVELWAIYAMEYDAQVLEYFDQPHTLTLTYQSPSGRTVRTAHTPDFLGDEHETCQIPDGRAVNQPVSHARRVKASLTPAPIRHVPAQRSIH
jgi:hypothetical protein